MIARIAAAATITHLAHIAGHQNMANTTMAAANKNRQKQSFMIFPPSSIEARQFYKNINFIAMSKYNRGRVRGDINGTFFGV
jgi:hypothetical protein